MKVNTPCIGICSSVYGDSICRGCKRTALEVIDWNRYTLLEKQAVYNRLEQQISSILLKYIDIVNEALLQEQIKKLKICLYAQATAVEQAFHLLRLGADKIKNIEGYGVRIKPELGHPSLKALFGQIDEEIYLLAVDMDPQKDLS